MNKNKVISLVILLLNLGIIAVCVGQEQADSAKLVDEYFKLGQDHCNHQNYQDAFKAFNQAKTMALQNEQYDKLGRICDYIGYVHSLISEWQQAISNYNQAIVYYKQIGVDEKISSAFLRIGYCNWQLERYELSLNDYDSSEYYLLKEQEKGRLTDDKIKETHSKILFNRGRSLSELADYQGVLKAYKSALKLYEDIGDSTSIVSNWRGIGLAYKQLGYYDEAIKYYLLVAGWYEQNLNYSKLDDIYNAIGILYKELKNWSFALKFYAKALELRIDIGDQLEVAHSYNNIGNLYLEQAQIDSGLYFLHKALVLKKEFKNKKELATTRENLGKAYLMKGELDSAEYYLLRATSPSWDEEYGDVLMSTNHQLAKLHIAKGDLYTAQVHFYRAMHLAEKHGLASSIIEIYQTGIDVLKARGKFSDALHFSELKERAQDSIYRTQRLAVQEVFHESQIQQKETETQLAEERADQEEQEKYLFVIISLISFITAGAFVYLWNRNRKQKVLIAQLYDALNHRSRNDLQILGSEVRYRLGEPEANAQEQGVYIQQIIQALQLAYQAFSSKTLASKGATAEYITHLARSIQAGYGHKSAHVELLITVLPIKLDISQLTVVGFVLVELLTNIFKHAFNQDSVRPVVQVNMWEKNGKVCLEVIDNGIGLPADLQVDKLESEGLQEMYALAKQLKGSFDINNADQGTEALLKFPTNH